MHTVQVEKAVHSFLPPLATLIFKCILVQRFNGDKNFLKKIAFSHVRLGLKLKVEMRRNQFYTLSFNANLTWANAIFFKIFLSPWNFWTKMHLKMSVASGGRNKRTAY